MLAVLVRPLIICVAIAKPTMFWLGVIAGSILAFVSNEATAFAPHAHRSPGWIRTNPGPGSASRIRHVGAAMDDSFVDAEFERISQPSSDNTAVTEKEKSGESKSSDSNADDSSPKSLLDLSLDMDPEWKEARIPFVDPSGKRYIDCKLAFTVNLDGVDYGIGIPFDAAAAMTLELPDGTVTYLSPDDDDNEELMEIMANQLQESLGTDVFLKKTPKILTIAGDLDKYTKNWKDDLFGETVDKETLLDDSDEDLDFFYDFMKKEMGEEDFAKALKEANEEQDIDEDLMKLFEVPGLGDEMDSEKMKELLESALDEDQFAEFEKISVDLDHEGVALKLVGFNFSDGKAYTLVKLLKPFTMVGKYVDDKEDLRFDLLTPEDEQLVVPRLEKLCERDLKKAGLSLSDFD